MNLSNMLKTEELLEKVEDSWFVIEFQNIFHKHNVSKTMCVKLIGGAVVDILDDRKPKDYDVIVGVGYFTEFQNILLKEGYDFVSATKTAITYKLDDIVIQILKTNPDEFDFKISQTAYDFKYRRVEIDKVSWLYRTLIPTSFEKQHVAIDGLKRIPHWKKKGFKIDDLTYLSLLGVALGKNGKGGYLES